MASFRGFKEIDAFVFDVDGVFTNGDVLVTESGEQLRSFNTKDGYALQLAVKLGYHILIVSGGMSNGVIHRFTSLGVQDIFIGVDDKLAVFKKWITEKKLNKESVLFMGDDISDISVMREVGLPTCPLDAVEEVKDICDYISNYPGGRGAVRDVIEKVMRLQGKWNPTSLIKSI